jgi:hypothetical protein
MTDSWQLLPWEYVCDQAPAIRADHEAASAASEYGCNFYEFIYTTEGLERLAQAWWDSLLTERKYELLKDQLEKARTRLNALIEATDAAYAALQKERTPTCP